MRVDTLNAMILNRLAVITVDATLRTAACALSKPHVGLLVVCEVNRRAAGVVSKSDIVRRLTVVGVAEASVATLMSREIVSCCPGDDLYATWQKMSARTCRICLCSAPVRSRLVSSIFATLSRPSSSRRSTRNGCSSTTLSGSDTNEE